MKKALDLIGKTFNMLTVEAKVKGGYLVRCECGTKKVMSTTHIKRNKSCGCYKKKINTKHGLRKHPLYNTWNSMIARCTKPTNNNYHKYGAKGITVCDRWLEFSNFIEDMGSKPFKTYTLDRIDNSKGYCPENCRWASKKTQTRNRTCVKMTKDQVEEIRKLKEEGVYYKDLAKKFNISTRQVYTICSRKQWQ